MVHHDLWDYDVAAQPVLIEFGRSKTPAVVVTTKMGLVYVLDRKTGKPLVARGGTPGAEERHRTVKTPRRRSHFPVAIEPWYPADSNRSG